MTNPSDRLNEVGRPLNAPGDLLGGDAVSQATRAVTRYSEDVPRVFTRPQSLRRFVSRYEPDTAAAGKVKDSPKSATARRLVTGQLSGVLALREIHRARVKFWDAAGVVGALVDTSKASPSAAQVAQATEDLRLFSDMPAELQPDDVTIERLVTPARHGDVITEVMVVSGFSDQGEEAVPSAGSSVYSPLPPPPPFVERLSDLCTVGIPYVPAY